MPKGQFKIPELDEKSSYIYAKAKDERSFLILAHGAGAPMDHPFMEDLAKRLVKQGISVFRFNFIYSHNGKKAPDRAPKLLTAWKAAIHFASSKYSPSKLYLGGKSMGGRMASLLSTETEVAKLVKGVVYYGFPLHAPNKPSLKRSDHFKDMKKKHLFLQGTRDALCDLDMLKSVLPNIKKSKLSIIEDGDHSFKVLKRSSLTQDETMDLIINETVKFCC